MKTASNPRLAWRLAVICALAACSEPASQVNAQSPTNAQFPSSSPTPEESFDPLPDPVYTFTAPKLVGLKLKDARASIDEALATAAIDDTVTIRLTVWNERESDEPPGTILDIHKPRGYRPGAELTLEADSSTVRVRSEISVVVAVPRIKFHGDSIYVGGAGSAFITWLDSNFNIHQRTLPLPAWFAVPQGVENFNAQRQLGDNGEIVCEIRYDDETYSRSRSVGPYAICSATA